MKRILLHIHQSDNPIKTEFKLYNRLRFTFTLASIAIIGAAVFMPHRTAAQALGAYRNFRASVVPGVGINIAWNTQTPAWCNAALNFGAVPGRMNFGKDSNTQISETACGVVTTQSTNHIATIPLTTICSRFATQCDITFPPSSTQSNSLTLTPGNSYFIELVGGSFGSSGTKSFYYGNAGLTPGSVTPITENTAQVNFTTGATVCAEVNYGLVSGALDNSVTDCVFALGSYIPRTTHNTMLTGLLPGTRYYYTSSVFDTNGSVTTETSFITAGGVCEYIGGGPTVESVTSNTIVINSDTGLLCADPMRICLGDGAFCQSKAVTDTTYWYGMSTSAGGSPPRLRGSYGGLVSGRNYPQLTYSLGASAQYTTFTNASPIPVITWPFGDPDGIVDVTLAGYQVNWTTKYPSTSELWYRAEPPEFKESYQIPPTVQPAPSMARIVDMTAVPSGEAWAIEYPGPFNGNGPFGPERIISRHTPRDIYSSVWDEQPAYVLPNSNYELHSIDAANGNSYWAVGNWPSVQDYYVRYYKGVPTTGEVDTAATHNPYLESVIAITDTTAIAVGDRGSVYKYDQNKAAKWTNLQWSLAANATLLSVASVDGQTIWVGTDGNRVLKSTNGGASFPTTVILPQTSTGLTAIGELSTLDGQTVIAGGSQYGDIWISKDGGTNWTALTFAADGYNRVGRERPVVDIYQVSNQEFYFVLDYWGGLNSILHYRGDLPVGARVNDYFFPQNGPPSSIDGIDGGEVFAGGSHGTINDLQWWTPPSVMFDPALTTVHQISNIPIGANLYYRIRSTAENLGPPPIPLPVASGTIRKFAGCEPTETCASRGWFCGSFTDSCNLLQDCGQCDSVTETCNNTTHLCELNCTSNWSCSAWSACAAGNQTRTCTDANSCSPANPASPPVTQACACTSNWSCSAWSACAAGNQTRTCTDANSCSPANPASPPVTQACACTSNWSCSAWSACAAGNQTRTCTDANSCSPANPASPPVTQACGCTSNWSCSAWSACAAGNQTRTCTDANSCSPANPASPPQTQVCCDAKTCAELGAQCGDIDNGCGTTINCPDCGEGQVCVVGNQCVAASTEPLATTAFQCNGPDCYKRGQLKNPLPVGCYRTWKACRANTILKVRKDRDCNLWMTCGTSFQTKAAKNKPAESLCLSLTACNELGAENQCSNYLPPGQCSNDPMRFCISSDDCEGVGTCLTATTNDPLPAPANLTYATPTNVGRISYMTGQISAGLVWDQVPGLCSHDQTTSCTGNDVCNAVSPGSTCVRPTIEGKFPWQLMRQIGENVQIINGDFEYDGLNYLPWMPLPSTSGLGIELEGNREKTESLFSESTPVNHYLVVSPDTSVPFPGVASDTFVTAPNQYYYVEARVKAQSGEPTVRIMLANWNEETSSFMPPPNSFYREVTVTNAWQLVSFGPVKGLNGSVRFIATCPDVHNCEEFWLDDVQVKPALQISDPADADPQYVTPSCRLFPKEDSPSCEYRDTNGVKYRGWRGFCLERDSQTDTCLSWWPIDIISGEPNIFGGDTIVGYQGRYPLYICAETEGVYNTRQDNGYGQMVDTFQGKMCHRDPTGGTTAMLCDQPLKNFHVMSTLIGETLYSSGHDNCSNHDSCCHLEDVGELRGRTAWGIFYCNIGDSTWTVDASVADKKINRHDVEYFTLNYNRFDTRGHHNSGGQWSSTMPNFILDESNNWSIHWFAMDHDDDHVMEYGVDIRLNWNIQTGYLESYTLRAYHYQGEGSTDDNAGGFWATGLFAMKEKCTKLIQVVSPSGQAKAFTTRINSKTYSVPDLNYGKGQDYAPFGGIVMPEPTPDAYWNQAGEETIREPFYAVDPDKNSNADLPDPYQARSGSPYACIGQCPHPVCTTAPGLLPGAIKSEILCDTKAHVSSCRTNNVPVDWNSSDNDPDGANIVLRGRCVGVPVSSSAGGVSAANKKGPQLFNRVHNPAQTGSTSCQDPVTLTCQAADVDRYYSNAALGSVHTDTPSHHSFTGGTWYDREPTPAEMDATRALARTQAENACATIVANNGDAIECNGRSTACTGGTPVYYDPAASTSDDACEEKKMDPWTLDPDGNFNFGVYYKIYCNATCRLGGDKTYLSVQLPGSAYFAQEHIRRLFVEAWGMWQWTENASTRAYLPAAFPAAFSGDNKWYPPTAICPTTTILPNQCQRVPTGCTRTDSTLTTSDSVAMPLPRSAATQFNTAWADLQAKCDAKPACDGRNTNCVAPNDGTIATYDGTITQKTICQIDPTNGTKATCSGYCKVNNKRYQRATYNSSGAALVTSYSRPDFPNDYCAIPPQIVCPEPAKCKVGQLVQFAKGLGYEITINGGAKAEIKFNVKADPDQEPLDSIIVHWGDGDTYTYNASPYAARNDPSNPYPFSHPYFYKSNSPSCDSAGRCVYQISIQVKDNWGWCSNGGNDFVDPPTCAPQLTGLTVVVNP